MADEEFDGDDFDDSDFDDKGDMPWEMQTRTTIERVLRDCLAITVSVVKVAEDAVHSSILHGTDLA